MLDKFKPGHILHRKKKLPTSKYLVNNFTVPRKEKKVINHNISSLILQSIHNFFIESGRADECNKIPWQKKYNHIESDESITLFPFLGNEARTGYNKAIVFGAYCDLLQYLVQKNKSKETITSVLNNIKIIYFQNPTEIGPLLNICTSIIQSGLQYTNSSYESVNSFFSSFDCPYVATDASTHATYFKEMLSKQPFYTSRKFLVFGLAGLGLIGYFISQSETGTTDSTTYKGPIIEDIEYPRNHSFGDTINQQSPSIPQNGPLYTHQSTGINVLPVEDEQEYNLVSSQMTAGVGVNNYNPNNEYGSISTTVADSHLKIDREITKKQLYKVISLLRKNKSYNINDITYGISDEIRIEDLPEGVAGLFKNWSDSPTDKDIYLDIDLVDGGTQVEQEHVLIHEFIHSVIGTSPSTLRNEGMTEALTQRSFYDSRNIDLFNYNDPYSPHVLDFIMIHNAYGSGYDGFEHFGLELVYNYKDLSTPAINPEYASGLAYILSTNPKSVISPIVIAFFTGGLEGIVQSKEHFLCTPGTKKGFDITQKTYEESELYSIEQNNTLSIVEKVQKAIDYFEANKGTLSAISPHDELPGNTINVNFGNNDMGGSSKTRGGENIESTRGNGKSEQNNGGESVHEKNNGGTDNDTAHQEKNNHREGDISRGEFLRDLALNIVVAGANGRLGIHLDEQRYSWYDGKIDPQYFTQQIKNVIKDKIEIEITKNGNWELAKDEKTIIENIVDKNFKTTINSLAQSFEHEMKGEQTYTERVQNNLDFLDENNPRSLQNTSNNIVNEYLKTIDLTSLILQQENIYDIIDVIAQQDVLSEEFLHRYFTKEFSTYVQESNIEGTVPFFKEKYLSIDDAARVMAEQYSSLINANTHITYTFEKNQSTIQRIKEIIQEKHIGIIDAIKIVLLEQNEGEITKNLKKSPFYQEAVHRYTDPLGADKNYLLKHMYDILDFVDQTKLPISVATSCLLLVMFLSYGISWKENKNETNHALLKKYNSRTNQKDNFPIHDYINKKEIQHTISAKDNKLRLLNTVLLLSFIIGWSTTNMTSYKKDLLQRDVEYYIQENPRRKRTPYTYTNLLLLQNPEINILDKNIRIEKSYTDEDYTHLYGLQSGSFPFDPYLNYGATTSLPTNKAKNITRIYQQVKGDNLSTPNIIATHQNIQIIIGTTSLENVEKKLSIKGLLGAILLTIGSLTSLLLFAYNTSKHLKQIEIYRKKIGKLISLPGLHSVNEREIDLILKNGDNGNDLAWQKIEYFFSSLTIIREANDITNLLGNLNIHEEKQEKYPFTSLLKNNEGVLDREILGNLAYSHLGEELTKNIERYNNMIINYERQKLLPGGSNKGILEMYYDGKNDYVSELYHIVVLNFIEYYLPRIIIAQTRGRSVETYINRLPYSEKVAYFTNVKFIKDGLVEHEQTGETQTNGFNIHSIMTPQVTSNEIQQPATTPSTLRVGW